MMNGMKEKKRDLAEDNTNEKFFRVL